MFSESLGEWVIAKDPSILCQTFRILWPYGSECLLKGLCCIAQMAQKELDLLHFPMGFLARLLLYICLLVHSYSTVSNLRKKHLTAIYLQQLTIQTNAQVITAKKNRLPRRNKKKSIQTLVSFSERHASALRLLLIISGTVEINPGPLFQGRLQNTCLTRPSYYSCAIDSLCELFKHCIFPGLRRFLNEHECELVRLFQTYCIETNNGGDLSQMRNVVWDELCRLFPSAFLPKGAYASIDDVIENLRLSTLFCLRRQLHCTECQSTDLSNHDICPVYIACNLNDSVLDLRAKVYDVVMNVRRGRRCSVCNAHLSVANLILPSQIIVSLPMFYTTSNQLQISRDVIISETLALNGMMYYVRGAIRCSGGHFTAIVEKGESFYELDDLSVSTPVRFNNFVSCCNKDHNSNTILKKTSCIRYIVFKQFESEPVCSGGHSCDTIPAERIASLMQDVGVRCEPSLNHASISSYIPLDMPEPIIDLCDNCESGSNSICSGIIPEYAATTNSNKTCKLFCDANFDASDLSDSGPVMQNVDLQHAMCANNPAYKLPCDSNLDASDSSDSGADMQNKDPQHAMSANNPTCKLPCDSNLDASDSSDSGADMQNKDPQHAMSANNPTCKLPCDSNLDASDSSDSGPNMQNVDYVIDEVVNRTVCESRIDDSIQCVIDKAVSGTLDMVDSPAKRRRVKENIRKAKKRKLDYQEKEGLDAANFKPPPRIFSTVNLHRDKGALEFEKDIESTLYKCLSCNLIKFKEDIKLSSSKDTNIEAKSAVHTLDGAVCKSCDSGKKDLLENCEVHEIPLFSKLNFLEKRMLNLINVFMTIVCLPGGQKGEIGQAVHFFNDLKSVKVRLPFTLKTSDVLIFEETESGLPEKLPIDTKFVRLDLLRNCYKWLIQNNHLFRDFRFNTLPFYFMKHDSCSMKPELTAINESAFIDQNYQPTDVKTFFNSNRESKEYGAFSFMKVDQKPLDFLSEYHLEAKSFVSLFPHGVNDFQDVKSKNHQLTLQKYFKKRLLSIDNRFRLNSSYLFWALNLLEQNRLQARISIALKSKHFKLATDIDKSIERVLCDKGYSFIQNIRGTVGYWMNVLMDLLAKVATLGPPTWFVTVSADDLHWFDYQSVLKSDLGSESGSNATNVIKNPVICALQFRRRWLALRRYMKKSKCLGEIVDSFERVEFQSRGSPHIHMFLWIKNAPKLSDADAATSIPRFIDRYVYTTRPKNADDAELTDHYQTHKHTETCFKNGRNTCRFGFPKKPCEETHILKEKRVGAKRFYETKRGHGDEWLNCYNIDILRVFRSNMDIQFVGDVYGVCVYVCGYICKAEPKKFREEIENVIRKIRETASGLSLRQVLSKFGTAIITKRCVSAQEAAFRILSIPLCYSTRKSVFVNCRSKGERDRILKNNAGQLIGNDNMVENDVECLFVPGLIEYYCNRPQTDLFEHMSLARFAAWYTLHSTSKKSIPLADGSCNISRREKPACLRTNVFSHATDPENYYMRLLMLHLPFRNESQLKVPFRTYELSFESNYTRLDREFLGIEHFHTELQSVIQRLQFMQSETLEDLVSHLLRSDSLNVDITGPDYDDLAPEFDCFKHTENEKGSLEILENDTCEKVASMFKLKYTDEGFAKAVRSLNDDQTRIFLKIKNAVQANILSGSDALRMFVSGPAGTGKSFLISLISELVTRMCAPDLNQVSVLRSALTGVASRNIDGITLHRSFLLPVDHNYRSPLYPLKPATLQTMRDFFKGVKLLIIDEISMVSYRFFEFIHRRLCEIKGSNELFGGLNIVVLGDFCQLKPVMDSFIFKDRNELTHIFNDHFLYDSLNIQMRQSSDLIFAELLSRLRLGACSEIDIQLLRSRLNVHLCSSDFDDALRIYPTKKQVKEYNNNRLQKLESSTNRKSIKCLSSDRLVSSTVVVSQGVSDDDAKSSGLPRELNLLENARVMLIRNVSCEDGLTNGTLGTILSLNDFVDDAPTEIVVQFDGLKDRTVVEQMSVKFLSKDGKLCERRQFPIQLAWACTIHKVQGLTLAKAVVDIGQKIFQPAMAYVALSRVRSIKDLSLSDFCSTKLTCFREVLAYYTSKNTS